MNLTKLFTLTFSIMVMVSCASLNKKGTSSFSDSDSPYVEEQTPTPKPKVQAPPKNIVVREEKVKAIESETDKTNYNYYVIIGSFRILDNAYNYKKQINEEGFKSVILENENGLYRVSVIATNAETDARNEISRIRSNYSQHSDVWLLISK